MRVGGGRFHWGKNGSAEALKMGSGKKKGTELC